jgi:ATP-dependent DNA ligase
VSESALGSTLYKRTSTGAIQEWEIWVVGNTIHYASGQLGGKMVKNEDTIKSGKNIGKKNETTPEQQAQLEMQQRITKQLKKGYVETIEAAQAGETHAVIEGGRSPMLAHVFWDHKHKVTYPCAVQPKLNGHRCIAENGELWSRNRMRITAMPHIQAAVNGLDCVLDGELYHHSLRTNLKQISAYVKPDEPVPGGEILEYWVYDVWTEEDVPFIDRIKLLEEKFGGTAYKHDSPIKVVKTVIARSEHDVLAHLDEWLMFGYEGVMVRNLHSRYVSKRSYDLLKAKKWRNGEFEIVGVKEGRGKYQGCVGSFVLKLRKPATDKKKSTTFDCKLEGTVEEQRAYFKNPPIGQKMTVRFFDYTDYGVPFHPVGVEIRDPKF